jgi:hypothetical protein
MKNLYISNGDTLMHYEEVNLNILHVLVLDGVGGEVYNVDIVVVDKRAPCQRIMEPLKQLTKPGCVLNINTRAGDDQLLLQGPRDKAVT